MSSKDFKHSFDEDAPRKPGRPVGTRYAPKAYRSHNIPFTYDEYIAIDEISRKFGMTRRALVKKWINEGIESEASSK